MYVLISTLIFALAVSVKGGLLGKVFKNWGRYVGQRKTIFNAYIEVMKTAWKDKDYATFVRDIPGFLLTAFVKWFMDGSVISMFIVFVYVAASQPSLTVAALFALSWCLIWMSMGEEAGAAGDYKGAWGEYITATVNGKLAFGRSYGIKKGIQYGAFAGAGMALAIGSWTLWIAGAMFPLCYYLGNCFQVWVSGGKHRGWQFSEPLWGAAVGLAYGLAHAGFLPV